MSDYVGSADLVITEGRSRVIIWPVSWVGRQWLALSDEHIAVIAGGVSGGHADRLKYAATAMGLKVDDRRV